MSRIGKKPIQIIEGTEIKLENSSMGLQKVIVKGPKGELSLDIPKEVKVEVREKEIFVFPQASTKRTKAMWGLIRALIANMVLGTSKGYEKKLEIHGVGYTAKLAGQDLELKVGYVNNLLIKAPEGITFSVEKNQITVSGIDKELVGQVAAKIRKAKPAEPYKGKGIRYAGEIIRRKVGKRVAAAGGGA